MQVYRLLTLFGTYMDCGSDVNSRGLHIWDMCMRYACGDSRVRRTGSACIIRISP